MKLKYISCLLPVRARRRPRRTLSPPPNPESSSTSDSAPDPVQNSASSDSAPQPVESSALAEAAPQPGHSSASAEAARQLAAAALARLSTIGQPKKTPPPAFGGARPKTTVVKPRVRFSLDQAREQLLQDSPPAATPSKRTLVRSLDLLVYYPKKVPKKFRKTCEK